MEAIQGKVVAAVAATAAAKLLDGRRSRKPLGRGFPLASLLSSLLLHVAGSCLLLAPFFASAMSPFHLSRAVPPCRHALPFGDLIFDTINLTPTVRHSTSSIKLLPCAFWITFTKL